MGTALRKALEWAAEWLSNPTPESLRTRAGWRHDLASAAERRAKKRRKAYWTRRAKRHRDRAAVLLVMALELESQRG